MLAIFSKRQMSNVDFLKHQLYMLRMRSFIVKMCYKLLKLLYYTFVCNLYMIIYYSWTFNHKGSCF